MSKNSIYINLKEIWENHPDDYDKICELLVIKLTSKDLNKKAKAELDLSKYGL